ncbi:MAG TPA: BPSS1780 family membrane protein [Rubrivivax sp.]|nr:BPSS1780 family membrane protein [Rubrivivax sp.]HPO20410.1 BPSS1780 family membrane protein [Rubrivivax sp.]
MPLQLKTVEPRRGTRWVGDAFRLYVRRPLALTLLFVAFLAASTIVAAALPFVGSLLQLASLPLLSLGFMVATQSALLGGPVHPGQFVEPLRGDAQRRRALLWLCALYGAAAFAILLLCSWVSDDALTRLQALMARGDTTPEELDALLAEPGVETAALLLLVLGSALTVPFWHAPALVHWGGQGVGQALFSSTLALWRTKGAFALYGLTWSGLALLAGAGSALLFGLLGAQGLATLVALPLGLVFSTVFYVSLLFVFNDTFGSARGASSDAPPGSAVATPPGASEP